MQCLKRTLDVKDRAVYPLQMSFPPNHLSILYQQQWQVVDQAVPFANSSIFITEVVLLNVHQIFAILQSINQSINQSIHCLFKSISYKLSISHSFQENVNFEMKKKIGIFFSLPPFGWKDCQITLQSPMNMSFLKVCEKYIMSC